MTTSRTRTTAREIWLPDRRRAMSRAVWVALAVVALGAAYGLRGPLLGEGRPTSTPPQARPWLAVASNAAAFLAGWAEVDGTEIDAATRFPKSIRRTADRMRMVLIPAGTFPMGAVPGDSGADGDEEPRHDVTLSRAYYLDEHEVTVGMWKKFTARPGSNPLPSQPPESTDAHPVGNLSWHDAQPYVTWVNAALPTEAQWERAARGGHDEFVYPWGNADDVAKRNAHGPADGFDDLAPVKSFPPNGYGIFDMSGNVWEWCADSRREYERSAETDPIGPVTAVSILRGGSRIDDAALARASYRFDVRREEVYANVGFRCAKTLP